MSKDFSQSIIIRISILSYVSKIFKTFIFQRIKVKIEQSLSEEKLGLKNNMGTGKQYLHYE